MNGYGQVTQAYFGLNRIDEARAIINAAFQHKGSTKAYHVLLARLDWCEGKDAKIEKELQTASEESDGALEALRFRSKSCRFPRADTPGA